MGNEINNTRDTTAEKGHSQDATKPFGCKPQAYGAQVPAVSLTMAGPPANGAAGDGKLLCRIFVPKRNLKKTVRLSLVRRGRTSLT